MASAFRKATKRKSKLRAGLFGPSGAGKTMTALRVASGLGGTIGLIDSEHGSASKYSDRFDFLACDLEDKSVDGYIAAMHAAAEAGVDVLIIDSMSHAWQELLVENDRAAKSRHKGNTWAAWSESTPKQKRLVEAILGYPGHVIATMRSKTEWQSSSEGGKAKPVRVGMAPEQGKGIEYEFDLLLEISVEHVAEVIKDRTGKFQDKLLDKPGEDFGRALAAWLDDGEEATSPAPRIAPETQGESPGYRSWASFVTEQADDAAARGFTVNQFQIANHTARVMAEKGVIRREEIETDGKRDRKKVSAVLEREFGKGPKRQASIVKLVTDYIEDQAQEQIEEQATPLLDQQAPADRDPDRYDYAGWLRAWAARQYDDGSVPAHFEDWDRDMVIEAEDAVVEQWKIDHQGVIHKIPTPMNVEPEDFRPEGKHLANWLRSLAGIGPKPRAEAKAQARPQPAGDPEPPEHSAPRSGKALYAWAKEQQEEHEVGLIKYLNGWGKLREFPSRMVDWDADQVAQGYDEASRKLRSVEQDRAREEALTN